MKDSIILFLFLIPTFLFAQYPTGSNKSRLGWQTTGDGLIWRGVAGDTVNKPNNRNYPYFQLDTVNAVLYRYIATQGNWQAVGGGSIDIDSLVYATRFWVNSNFFPLQGGLLTGTGGNGFVGFPIQSSPPSTPATGFSLYAGSTGNNISWMQPDGFFRRLVSPVTGTPRQYQFMARSYTLGDSADIANNVTSIAANYIATSNGTNLVARNLFDNNTYIGILNSKPFQLGQWTTAGRPAGTTGYTGYNTTGNGMEWYQGSRWAYALESTFARGTATRVPFFDANGQVTDNSTITFTGNNKLNVSGGASFALSNNVGFAITGINTNNQYSLTGTNLEVLRFVPSATSFFGTGIVGSVLTWGSTYGFVGANLSTLTTNVTFPVNSMLFGATSTTSTGIIDRFRNGLLFLSNSGNFSTLQLYGGYGSGTNISVSAYPFRLTGTLGTGTGTPADIIFATGTSGSSGATTNTATDRWYIKATTGRLSNTSIPTEDFDVNGDVRVRDSLQLGTVPLMAGATKILTIDGSDWVGHRLASTIGGTSDSLWTSDYEMIFRNNASTRNDTIPESFFHRNGSGIHIPFQSDPTNYTTNQNANIFIGTIFSSDTTTTKLTLLDSDIAIGAGSYIANNAANYGITLLGHGSLVRGISTQSTVMGFTSNTTNSVNSSSYGVSNTLTNAGGSIIVGGFNTVNRASSAAFGSSHTINQANRYQYGNGANENSIRHFFYGNLNVGSDSSFSYNNTTNLLRLSTYGTPATTAAALSKTLTNYGVGFATDGTVTSREIKRDTTIYVDDADYDFSAAITTAQIASRFNRVIFWMTTTAAAGSDSELTLHTPDANLMQVEYLIHSVDEPAGFDNKIVFGTNNAVDSTNGLVTNYYPAAGDGIHIRAGLRSGVYKYRYSN